MKIDQRTALLEIVEVIRRANRWRDRDPLPVLADLAALLEPELSRDSARLQASLGLLVEARYLLTVRLVESDPGLRVEALNAYVVADLEVVRELREWTCGRLAAAYERQFYRRREAAAIIQELLPNARKYNRTHMGRLLAAAVALGEHERSLQASPADFSGATQERLLTQLLSIQSSSKQLLPEQLLSGQQSGEPMRRPSEAAGAGRAVDSDSGLEAERMDVSGEWGQAVEKFGVEFLLRIHFRKYEFNRIKYLVNTRRVAREPDLLFVRDTVRQLQTRALENQDPGLRRHITSMQNLLASVHLKLQMIALEKER